jgi:predicted dehydrogenase
MGAQYRAAIIGCGRMAGSIDDEVRDYPAIIFPYSHAGTYRACDRATLVAASDVIEDKLRDFCARWEIPRGYRDYRELIERERPDVVSVTTRPATHREIVLFAAEHGVKGIWCEKPLCCSMDEADSMVEACRQHGVKLNLGTNRSHTHASDLLLLLAGDPAVDYVQGTVGADVADYADDRVEIDPPIYSAYVRFADGLHGYLLATIGYDWEVTGSTGKLRTLNDGQSVELRRQAGKWKQLETAPPPDLPDASSALACLEDLVEAIETGRETKGNVELARRSQEIIMAIIASHGQNGARVALPLANRRLYVGKQDW